MGAGARGLGRSDVFVELAAALSRHGADRRLAGQPVLRRAAGDHVAARLPGRSGTAGCWAIHRHRGTISAAPNFAYELCLKRMRDEDIAGLDLGSWRTARNGAEPVSPDTIRRFARRFAPLRLCGRARWRRSMAWPRARSGSPFPRPAAHRCIDRIDRDSLATQRPCRAGAPDGARRAGFVACGQPIAGTRDPHRGRDRARTARASRGARAVQGTVRHGRILPRRPRRRGALFDGDWLETGDRGYVAAGDVLSHRPHQGHDHPRRPPSLPAGAGGTGRRGGGGAARLRGRDRQPRSRQRHRAAGGGRRDPPARAGGAGRPAPADRRSLARHPAGHAARRSGAGAAARDPENLQRQAPAGGDARPLRTRRTRAGTAAGLVAARPLCRRPGSVRGCDAG